MTTPYMPLYVADYMADTAHLTAEESGAYLFLIMTYWQTGKPLPADPKRLALIARLPNERWTDVERTLSPFFTTVDGTWRHKRIDEELAKYRTKVEKAKMAGKASAKSKKSTPGQRTLNGRSTDAQPEVNHSESDTDSGEVVTPLTPLTGESDDLPSAPKIEKTAKLDPDGVSFDGLAIHLDESHRAFWLERFGGDAGALDLALMQAAGLVQKRGSHPLVVQVGRQLARISADRSDRDRRYREAASRRQSSAPDAPVSRDTGKTIYDLLGMKPTGKTIYDVLDQRAAS